MYASWKCALRLVVMTLPLGDLQIQQSWRGVFSAGQTVSGVGEAAQAVGVDVVGVDRHAAEFGAEHL